MSRLTIRICADLKPLPNYGKFLEKVIVSTTSIRAFIVITVTVKWARLRNTDFHRSLFWFQFVATPFFHVLTLFYFYFNFFCLCELFNRRCRVYLRAKVIRMYRFLVSCSPFQFILLGFGTCRKTISYRYGYRYVNFFDEKFCFWYFATMNSWDLSDALIINYSFKEVTEIFFEIFVKTSIALDVINDNNNCTYPSCHKLYMHVKHLFEKVMKVFSIQLETKHTGCNTLVTLDERCLADMPFAIRILF